MPAIRRALISVSDKTAIIDFAQALARSGVEILSTGGTAQLLSDAGIGVIEVSDYTGFPEMMAGRVKTLHPKIHAGLLGRRGIDDEVMQQYAIAPIDLLAVNLYPFARTVAKPGCDLTTAIENIDIGGPALLRAGAKNYSAVTVVVDAADYDQVLAEMQDYEGAVSPETRFALALKAFEHTAQYDGAIANFLGAVSTGTSAGSLFPSTYNVQYRKAQELRYGENPHQAAAFYTEQPPSTATVASAKQLQGKALSFNNIADSDAALECVKTLVQPACVIVKHANPCGVAIADTLAQAYEQAFATDPSSAFGGIIAVNRTLDATTAQAILDRQFVEVIIAPAIDTGAQPVLASKANIRVLVCGDWTDPAAGSPAAGTPAATSDWDYQRVGGGLLLQERDRGRVSIDDLRIVTRRQPDSGQLNDLLFAWKVVKFVKSNAIVYAREGRTVGIGAGQMSRVDSARIAVIKAREAALEVSGSVMASDAFFPFRDGIDAAAAAGIDAVIQPGGSMRDAEVIAAADEHDLAMVFTGMRHFRH